VKPMPFFEALERVKDLVILYSSYEDQKNAYIKRGLDIRDIERNQRDILDELKSLTGERSIQYAKDLLKEHGVE
jgi:hypothetical protein